MVLDKHQKHATVEVDSLANKAGNVKFLGNPSIILMPWQRENNNYMKGHESMLYEAIWVIVGPFFIFAVVKM